MSPEEKAAKRAVIDRWLREQHAILGMELGLGLDRLQRTFAACEFGSSARHARKWEPSDGDGRCQDCGLPYEPWFTDNALWNVVMGGTADGDDPGGCICPRCFTIRAREDSETSTVWNLSLAPGASIAHFARYKTSAIASCGRRHSGSCAWITQGTRGRECLQPESRA